MVNATAIAVGILVGIAVALVVAAILLVSLIPYTASSNSSQSSYSFSSRQEPSQTSACYLTGSELTNKGNIVLRKQGRIDRVISNINTPKSLAANPLFWNVETLRAARSITRHEGDYDNLDVFVLDTGIQPDHPDLNVVGGKVTISIAQKAFVGVDFTGSTNDPPWLDDDGHGTVVAGLVAAIDDRIGIANGARLWAVKVLNSQGEGDDGR